MFSMIALMMSATVPVIVDTISVVYQNSDYAIVQDNDGHLLCYGCGETPIELKGSSVFEVGDDLDIAAASGMTIFLVRNAIEGCIAGQQWVINLGNQSVTQMNVPCQAVDFSWKFSQEEIHMSYRFSDKNYGLSFKIN